MSVNTNYVLGSSGLVDPYADPFLPITQQITGTLSLVDATTNSLIQAFYSGRMTDQDVNRYHQDLIQETERLTKLSEQLGSLRIHGRRPNYLWNNDSIINTCDTLLAQFRRLAADSDFEQKGWHFAGIRVGLETAKNEIVDCTRTFGVLSTRG